MPGKGFGALQRAGEKELVPGFHRRGGEQVVLGKDPL